MDQTNFYALKQDLILRIEEMAKLFVRNEDTDALNKLDSVTNALSSLSHHLSTGEVSRLRSHIAQMFQCLENKDYVRLSDILMYELKPWLQVWNGDKTI